MTLPIYQVDAFASESFAGNPAAVVFLTEERPTAWMQSVASEMNLSETAFVRALDTGRFDLRWFTPNTEVDLCGHATLAAGHLLWETKAVLHGQAIEFESRSGVLPVRQQQGLVELNFPVTAPKACDAPDGLMACFSDAGEPVDALYTGRSRFDVLLELAAESTVRSLDVDFGALAAIDCRGVIVTAKADAASPHDFVSRFFAPACNVPEDPVTGSAHCCLADYWGTKLGRQEMIGYQASQRGGTVEVVLQDDRVLLRGPAVTVFKGELLV